mmetsp:Transcript_3692/g.12408  ORF Transcript_3692/g.12408 Transcript_3692/m.12408 type:complete len:356 (+) Transcript_3692:991-2058(+)
MCDVPTSRTHLYHFLAQPPCPMHRFVTACHRTHVPHTPQHCYTSFTQNTPHADSSGRPRLEICVPRSRRSVGSHGGDDGPGAIARRGRCGGGGLLGSTGRQATGGGGGEEGRGARLCAGRLRPPPARPDGAKRGDAEGNPAAEAGGAARREGGAEVEEEEALHGGEDRHRAVVAGDDHRGLGAAEAEVEGGHHGRLPARHHASDDPRAEPREPVVAAPPQRLCEEQPDQLRGADGRGAAEAGNQSGGDAGRGARAPARADRATSEDRASRASPDTAAAASAADTAAAACAAPPPGTAPSRQQAERCCGCRSNGGRADQAARWPCRGLEEGCHLIDVEVRHAEDRRREDHKKRARD